MARTTAANFTGGLQFPRATAATDLFLKEDVQTLALAVDQHDHSAGKGLALVAGSIPNGSITSAMIADGAIQNTDLADNIITSAKIVDGTITQDDLAAGAKLRQAGTKYLASATFSSTTTGAYVFTPVQVVATLVGTKTVQVHFNIPLQNNNATAVILMSVGIDGGSLTQIGTWACPFVNATASVAGSYIYDKGSIPAGSHTFAIALFSTGGTMSINAAAGSHLWVTEWND